MSVTNVFPSPFPVGLKSFTHPVEKKSVDGAAAAPDPKEAETLKKACVDFESVFLNFMLSQMRETVPKSGLTGNGQGESLYRGMLDEELSKQMAASGGIGLAEMLVRQFNERK